MNNKKIIPYCYSFGGIILFVLVNWLFFGRWIILETTWWENVDFIGLLIIGATTIFTTVQSLTDDTRERVRHAEFASSAVLMLSYIGASRMILTNEYFYYLLLLLFVFVLYVLKDISKVDTCVRNGGFVPVLKWRDKFDESVFWYIDVPAVITIILAIAFILCVPDRLSGIGLSSHTYFASGVSFYQTIVSSLVVVFMITDT